jgi:hypothetical protein
MKNRTRKGGGKVLKGTRAVATRYIGTRAYPFEAAQFEMSRRGATRRGPTSYKTVRRVNLNTAEAKFESYVSVMATAYNTIMSETAKGIRGSVKTDILRKMLESIKTSKGSAWSTYHKMDADTQDPIKGTLAYAELINKKYDKSGLEMLTKRIQEYAIIRSMAGKAAKARLIEITRAMGGLGK